MEFLAQKAHVFKSLIGNGKLSSRKTVLIFILSTLYANFFSPQYFSILDVGPEERQRGERPLLKISGLENIYSHKKLTHSSIFIIAKK